MQFCLATPTYYMLSDMLIYSALSDTQDYKMISKLNVNIPCYMNTCGLNILHYNVFNISMRDFFVLIHLFTVFKSLLKIHNPHVLENIYYNFFFFKSISYTENYGIWPFHSQLLFPKN